MRCQSIFRFSIIVKASLLDCSFKCVPKKVFHLSYDQRIALLLIRNTKLILYEFCKKILEHNKFFEEKSVSKQTMILTLLYDTHPLQVVQIDGATLFEQLQLKSIYRAFIMGRRNQMSSLHRTSFLSADNFKSRRCLEHTLKVVVAIYVVENKIDGMHTIYDSFGCEKRMLKAGFVQISKRLSKQRVKLFLFTQRNRKITIYINEIAKN